jgi:hypothetical protein
MAGNYTRTKLVPTIICVSSLLGSLLREAVAGALYGTYRYTSRETHSLNCSLLGTSTSIDNWYHDHIRSTAEDLVLV